MKVAPLYHKLSTEIWCDPKIVHTGQHYDHNMSDGFFDDLRLPKPAYHLGVGSGSHAEQTAKVMVEYEKLCKEDKPDCVIVVGDVNSTMAATLAASKLQIPVAHLEAGLRSGDRTMPEEINRLVTDSIADLLWTPSQDADENLLREGAKPESVVPVGNIMIDSLEMLRHKIESSSTRSDLGLCEQGYVLVTLHRPANVDNDDVLSHIVTGILEISKHHPVVFPIHPRTLSRLREFSLLDKISTVDNITILAPQNYISFMNLVFGAKVILTDSGGVQEETSYLGIPCLTLRPNTERPITVTQGSNRLITELDLPNSVLEAWDHLRSECKRIENWDGMTSHRVTQSLKDFLKV